jgi:hypothetical protein
MPTGGAFLWSDTMKRLSKRTFWAFWIGLPLAVWLVTTPLLTLAFGHYGVKVQISDDKYILFYSGRMPETKE